MRASINVVVTVVAEAGRFPPPVVADHILVHSAIHIGPILGDSSDSSGASEMF